MHCSSKISYTLHHHANVYEQRLCAPCHGDRGQVALSLGHPCQQQRGTRDNRVDRVRAVGTTSQDPSGPCLRLSLLRLPRYALGDLSCRSPLRS